MEKRKQIKMIFAAVGILCFLCILYGVIRKGELALENRAAAEADGDSETLQKLLWGSLSLNGKKYRYSRDYESYLLMGTDASGNEEADREEYMGNMADFLLLAVVNRTEKTYGFLQLDRDTMTKVRMLGQDGTGYATSEIQLCTAHWYGGTKQESCENTVKAVSNLLGGLEIDGYYSINMEEISALNRAVGGVTVTVESDFSNIDPSLKMGETITLTDEQAEHFVRGRYGVDDETNVSRMGRQRQYMEAFFGKLEEGTKADPEFALRIYDQLADRAVTNMTGGMLSDLLVEMSEAENRGMFLLEGRETIGKHLGDGIEHAEFYPDKESIVYTMGQLYDIIEK